MKDNWYSRQDVSDFYALSDDLSACDYAESHRVSIGDERGVGVIPW